MKITKKFIVFLLLAILASITLSWHEVSLKLVLLSTGIVFFVIIAPTLYTILWERNPDKIERFLKSQQGQPYYQLVYAIANEQEKETQQMMDILLQKSKQRHTQALYASMYAFYKKDLNALRHEAELIRQPDYRRYYQTYVFLEEGRFSEAETVIPTISKTWMRTALQSHSENKQGNMEEAMKLAVQAIAQTRGLQLYVMVKTYQREYPELRFQEMTAS
ncbi:hypothetical protein [Paenibacillus pinihumi]|uniref:hypothetical protein n=1 Tax=Paenibacillus pinihumi TaxID=669462 RepID=UPI00041E2677|nr:hypothetical protein [Paenibacillus pinihumi]